MPNVTITIENTQTPDIDMQVRVIVYDPRANSPATQIHSSQYKIESACAEKVLNALKEDAGIHPLHNSYNGYMRVLPPTAGEQPLTIKEKQVLQLLSKGHSYKMIAKELNKSVETIRVQIKSIYKKLQVCSNTQAVIKAINEGML